MVKLGWDSKRRLGQVCVRKDTPRLNFHLHRSNMTDKRLRCPSLKDAKTMTTESLEKWCNANEMKAVKWEYTWTIHNYSFSEELKIGTRLESAEFSTSVDDKIKWILHLYPNGVDKSLKELLSLWLFCTSDGASIDSAECTFSIVNSKGSKISMHKYLVDQCKFGERHIGFPITFSRSDLFHDKSELLTNDKLTIVCEIIVFSKVQNVTRRISNWPEIKITRDAFSDDIDFPFESKESNDVTIVSNDKNEVKVHKAILTEHSPVFAAMFKHDMDEKKHNRVTISDVDHEILEEMIRFMYTGGVRNLNKMADSLLVAADKYAIEGLKFICEKKLGEILAINNASDTLIFADVCNADYLKTQAISFISKNLKDVINTEGYESMVKSHPYLINVILRGMAMIRDTEECLLFTIVRGGSELTLTKD